MIRALLFDFFGVVTLHNPGRSWFVDHTDGSQEQKDAQEKLFHNFDLGHVPTNLELTSKLGEIVGSSDTPEQILEDFKKRGGINDDLLAMIAGLRAKYRVGLLSNGHTPMLEFHMDGRDLNEYFDEVLISSETGVTKPEKEAYERACDRLKADMESVVFIDDEEKNIDASREYGMPSILYTGLDDARLQLAELGVII